jgi:hypothetical protein
MGLLNASQGCSEIMRSFLDPRRHPVQMCARWLLVLESLNWSPFPP